MPWKRGRSGARSFVANRRPYKSIGRKRKARVGSFKRRVRAIAKGVVHRQADLKHYDRILGAVVNSDGVTGTAIGAASITAGPALNTTGSTRIGSKIRAHKAVVNYTMVSGSFSGTNAGKQARVRVAVLEILDQNDNGILTSGTGLWDTNSADVNNNTVPSRMTSFFNLRKFRVLSDKQFMLGAPGTATLPVQMPTYIKHTYVHDFKGQEWIFNGITDGEVPNNRHVAIVWVVESENQARSAPDNVSMTLDVEIRVYYTD